MDAKSLANFLINEHPQTVSVILAHLEPEKKGEVLKRLPETLQAEVVLRMANLDHVAPELINEVGKVLKEELANIGTVEHSQLGGVQTVAEMLNVMDKGAEKAIMSRVEEKDPLLAEEIRKLMFIFDDIVKIDDQGIQALLKEVPNDKLLLAMKTANQEIRDKIFKNISKRAAEMLADDLATMGPARTGSIVTLAPVMRAGPGLSATVAMRTTRWRRERASMRSRLLASMSRPRMRLPS